MSDSIATIVYLGGSAIASFLAVRYSFARRLRRTKHYRIADLPENKRGRIVGTVKAMESTLVAPLSERPCVYYEVKIIERMPENHVCRLESAGVPFILDDGTGKAVIDPRNGRVEIYVDLVMDPITNAASPQLAGLLARANILPMHAAQRQLRYMEAVIQVGESVAVVGSGIRDGESHGDEGYRDANATRLLMGASGQSSLWIRKA